MSFLKTCSSLQPERWQFLDAPADFSWSGRSDLLVDLMS
jgi:hypothetical protein